MFKDQIIENLKIALRKRNLRYQDAANVLKLSPSMVKHLFKSYKLTLQRIDQLCTAYDIHFNEIFPVEAKQKRTIFLDAETERNWLESGWKLGFVSYITRGESVAEVCERSQVPRFQQEAFLNELERIGIVTADAKDGWVLASSGGLEFRFAVKEYLERVRKQKFQDYEYLGLLSGFEFNKNFEIDVTLEEAIIIKGILAETQRKLEQALHGRATEKGTSVNRRRVGVQLAMRPWEDPLALLFK